MSTSQRTSKFLSLVLRHRPEVIDIELDDQGWVPIDELISKANAKPGNTFTRAEIEDVVATNDKQRFSLSYDGLRIRANQGHSIEVDLALTALEPPASLFHGTATRFVEPILASGLTKQRRQHVHLSDSIDTASAVGTRHGKLAIFTVEAGRMSTAGYDFFRSANGVWLTDHVPTEYLSCR